MVLTDGPKMVVTPTYHVFEMYKVHQGGKLLATDLKAGAYKLDNAALPALHASASKAADGKIHITVCNLDPKNAADLKCDIQGGSVRKAEGRTLTAGSMNAHNTFDEPSAVTPATLEKIRLKGNTVQVTLPPMSVSVLTLQ
jgi:alpha-N-arabinofuranosidase